ncbi:MAG: FixH family protein [Rhodomicrobium sp.]
MSVVAMERRLTGKHVLFILLGCFSVVFAVNGFFAYSAIHTLSGEQRGATYEAGLHYNATLAEQRAQDELHWAHKAQLLPDSRLAVTFADASGSPVAGLAIEGWLERPASETADRKLTFKEVDAGRYEASDASPQAGAWILTITAQKPRPGTTPAIYRAKERLWIAPAH